MDSKIVLGIIAETSAQTALNNLEEADFAANALSVVMADENKARTFANDTGPLKGVTLNTLEKTLTALGVQKVTIQTYQEKLTQGEVLLAIEVPEGSVPAAEEMLSDYQPQNIEVVNTHA